VVAETKEIIDALREAAKEVLKEAEDASEAEKTQFRMVLLGIELLGNFLVDMHRIADAVEAYAVQEGAIHRSPGYDYPVA
jgi:hypothetical protein